MSIADDIRLPEEEQQQQEEKRRRKWLLLLLLLLLLLCCGLGLFYRYLTRPEPLPEIVPVVPEVDYPPHYLFSIYGVDRPVGVAVSPDGERIYVAEAGGDRLIKIFDRDGNRIGVFAPPDTRVGERSPVYLTVDAQGRVFVSDRLQHAIYVFDSEGQYLDTILDPSLALREFVVQQVGQPLAPDARFAFNIFWQEVRYRPEAEAEERLLPAPERAAWSPLGVRFDREGNLWVTDVIGGAHVVRFFPAEALAAETWDEFSPATFQFGEEGEALGQFLFPNVAVRDSQGRIYVSDGNNGRLSVWSAQGDYLFTFGAGTGEGALSLPRGAFIDEKDRLFVVDAVGQDVKVFNVSGEEPDFLYLLGEYGLDDGQFNYPNDIAVDGSGRLYIADRENNRIQVWSY